MKKELIAYKIKNKYIFRLNDISNENIKNKILNLDTNPIIAKEKIKIFNTPEESFAIFDEHIPKIHSSINISIPISFAEIVKILEKDNVKIKVNNITSNFNSFYKRNESKFIQLEKEILNKLLNIANEIKQKFTDEISIEFFDSLKILTEESLEDPTTFLSFKAILSDFFEWFIEAKKITRSPLNFEKNLNKFTKHEISKLLIDTNLKNPENLELTETTKNIGIQIENAYEFRVIKAIQKLFKEQGYIGNATKKENQYYSIDNKRFIRPTITFKLSDFFKALGMNYKTSGNIYKRYKQALKELQLREHTLISKISNSNGEVYRLTYTTPLISRVETLKVDKVKNGKLEKTEEVYSLELSRIFYEGLTKDLDPDGNLLYINEPADLWIL
ncbi:hypothetical protein [Marinitoga lauensis]|uniref:hypothetical protein n=1 Tax=Marinitoga lauensis TaxID=2201189 RepID=UPI0010121EF1|nr:hypothetical protein [Marinitoga lauensis]